MELTKQLMEFQEAVQAHELFEAWDDLVRHYKAEKMGANYTYSAGSLSEKNLIVHNAIQAIVERDTGGMKFNQHNFKQSTAYREVTMGVIGALIDATLPSTVEDTFGAFADVRNGGYGDSFSFDVESGDLFLVSKVGQGKRHVFGQKQYTGQVTLTPVPRKITVEEDLYRVLAGKRNLAEYAMKIMLSFETEISNDIYNAIHGTFASLPTEFKENTFAQDSFITLTQRVKAFNGGMNVSVFGTKLTLSKAIPANDYLKMGLGEEYNRTGYLGTFMGISLFEIPQTAIWNSATYEMGRDDNYLYVVSTGAEKLVKVCYEGQMASFSEMNYDNADLKQRTTMLKSWAVGLVSSAKFGIIKIA